MFHYFQNHKTLKELYLSHNKLETRNTRPIEFSFGKKWINFLLNQRCLCWYNSDVKLKLCIRHSHIWILFINFFLASSSLEILDLSWNCIRFTGAVDISRGLMVRMRFVVKCKDQLHVKFAQNALLELKCIISHGVFFCSAINHC